MLKSIANSLRKAFIVTTSISERTFYDSKANSLQGIKGINWARALAIQEQLYDKHTDYNTLFWGKQFCLSRTAHTHRHHNRCFELSKCIIRDFSLTHIWEYRIALPAFCFFPSIFFSLLLFLSLSHCHAAQIPINISTNEL